MITKRIVNIFLLSILAFYLHGLEEVLTGFYHVDPTIQWLAGQFNSVDQAVYYMFHFWWWMILPIAFLLLKGGKWVYPVLVFYGLVLFFESYHVMRALVDWHYFPGMITAFAIPVIGVFYWKELIKIFKG